MWLTHVEIPADGADDLQRAVHHLKLTLVHLPKDPEDRLQEEAGHGHCAVPPAVMRDVLGAVQRLSAVLPPQPRPIPIVHLWSGKDNETSAQRDQNNQTCGVPPMAQRVWLEQARVVPPHCL